MGRNLIISVFGRKGSGKTELTKKIARTYPRVTAVDTVAQYTEQDGWTVCMGQEACAAALVAAHRRQEYKLALRSDDTEELLALFPVIYELPDSLVIVDETPFYCSPSKLPRELSLLVRLGRHRNISQIYVAQRPAEVHRSITAQSDIIVSFQQREKRDIQYLIEAGGGVDAEHVEELPRFQLIAFGDGMERRDVPLAILAQRKEFAARRGRQLDAFEEES